MSDHVIFICGPEEIWLPVPGWENLYAISNLGRVRSLRTKRTKAKGGFLTPQLAGSRGVHNMRLVVQLYDDAGRRTSRTVHSLVMEAFVGPYPAGHLVCHGTFGPYDNHLVNLRYGTPKENSADTYRDGTVLLGERANTAKLTASLVRQARVRVANGETRQAIAQEYGVSAVALGNAVARRTWRHVA